MSCSCERRGDAVDLDLREPSDQGHLLIAIVRVQRCPGCGRVDADARGDRRSGTRPRGNERHGSNPASSIKRLDLGVRDDHAAFLLWSRAAAGHVSRENSFTDLLRCGSSTVAGSRSYAAAVVDRRLLVLVCAVVMVETLFFAALTPLLPELSREFGLSKTGVGVLSGAYAAGGHGRRALRRMARDARRAARDHGRGDARAGDVLRRLRARGSGLAAGRPALRPGRGRCDRVDRRPGVARGGGAAQPPRRAARHRPRRCRDRRAAGPAGRRRRAPHGAADRVRERRGPRCRARCLGGAHARTATADPPAAPAPASRRCAGRTWSRASG